jgi:hypothetical protein
MRERNLGLFFKKKIKKYGVSMPVCVVRSTHEPSPR